MQGRPVGYSALATAAVPVTESVRNCNASLTGTPAVKPCKCHLKRFPRDVFIGSPDEGVEFDREDNTACKDDNWKVEASQPCPGPHGRGESALQAAR